MQKSENGQNGGLKGWWLIRDILFSVLAVGLFIYEARLDHPSREVILAALGIALAPYTLRLDALRRMRKKNGES